VPVKVGGGSARLDLCVEDADGGGLRLHDTDRSCWVKPVAQTQLASDLIFSKRGSSSASDLLNLTPQ
jgi:hypothetical protein